MTVRVIHWATGPVGMAQLREIVERTDLDLAEPNDMVLIISCLKRLAARLCLGGAGRIAPMNTSVGGR
jgi:hypothetical protein